MATRVWDFLLNRSDGECWRIIKNVKSKNGLEAYRQIHNAFDPKTDTSGPILRSRIHALVTHPAKRIEDTRAVMNALDHRIRMFEENSGETFCEKEALSILQNLMHEDIRKHLALNVNTS